MKKLIVFIPIFFISIWHGSQEHSAARMWMDQALQAVKWDSQGSTIHARDLYHLSLAMYEAWAVYQPHAEHLLLGKEIGEFECEFDASFDLASTNIDSACNQAIHDAANETCLSRIWGGIHPPADDISGRRMGIKTANLALDLVNSLIE